MEDNNNDAINFIKAWLKVILSLCYCYFICSRIRKGMYRFISLSPVFYLFTILPFYVSRPIPIIILSGFLTWLANFKLLLYSFNYGPLSTNRPYSSFPRFFFMAAFPVAIKERMDARSFKKQSSARNYRFGKVVPLTYFTKVSLFVLLEVIYNKNIENTIVLCGLMYLFIDILFGLCDFVVRTVFDVELQPPSDEPYLSTSLQDFWGKRWNHLISSALRDTVYKPTKSTIIKYVGPTKWAPLIGVMGCFVVSGLMHELIYYQVTRVGPTWEVTCFFVLHGICVVLEMWACRALGPNRRLHWAVSGPLTIGFVMVTGFWLFFPQILRNDVDKKATEDIMGFGIFLKEVLYKGLLT